MATRCVCGRVLIHSFDALGCVECGSPCCPTCGVFLESVMYCVPCASARLEVPLPGREAA